MAHPESLNAVQKRQKFLDTLLDWAETNLRDFPWRKTKKPYRMLVAEIMLQRTKAEQVVPVFNCFVKMFPTPLALADASEEDIYQCIKSLGLKKRPTVLKLLGEQLSQKYNGNVPATEKELLEIFGVGQYAANAVLCYAYKRDVVATDANVARVLDRVFSLRPKTVAQKDRNIQKFAKDLVPDLDGKCRAFNLGILDLASAICTPRNPKCPICPLKSICDYAQIKFSA